MLRAFTADAGKGGGRGAGGDPAFTRDGDSGALSVYGAEWDTDWRERERGGKAVGASGSDGGRGAAWADRRISGGDDGRGGSCPRRKDLKRGRRPDPLHRLSRKPRLLFGDRAVSFRERADRTGALGLSAFGGDPDRGDLRTDLSALSGENFRAHLCPASAFRRSFCRKCAWRHSRNGGRMRFYRSFFGDPFLSLDDPGRALSSPVSGGERRLYQRQGASLLESGGDRYPLLFARRGIRLDAERGVSARERDRDAGVFPFPLYPPSALASDYFRGGKMFSSFLMGIRFSLCRRDQGASVGGKCGGFGFSAGSLHDSLDWRAALML